MPGSPLFFLSVWVSRTCALPSTCSGTWASKPFQVRQRRARYYHMRNCPRASFRVWSFSLQGPLVGWPWCHMDVPPCSAIYDRPRRPPQNGQSPLRKRHLSRHLGAKEKEKEKYHTPPVRPADGAPGTKVPTSRSWTDRIVFARPSIHSQTTTAAALLCSTWVQLSSPRHSMDPPRAAADESSCRRRGSAMAHFVPCLFHLVLPTPRHIALPKVISSLLLIDFLLLLIKTSPQARWQKFNLCNPHRHGRHRLRLDSALPRGV